MGPRKIDYDSIFESLVEDDKINESINLDIDGWIAIRKNPGLEDKLENTNRMKEVIDEFLLNIGEFSQEELYNVLKLEHLTAELQKCSMMCQDMIDEICYPYKK